MSRPVLIGLHGRKGSGKDTAFGYIEDWAEGRGLTAARRGFADKLKHSALLALGFQIAEQDAIVLADSLKNLGEITTVIPGQSVLYTIEGRKFLQLYGKEAHRDIFGDDFWVDALLPGGFVNAWPADFDGHTTRPAWHRNFDFADICVITDCRFGNEAQRIRDLGGVVWAIDRPVVEDGDDHVSEISLPPELVDLTIDNNGSLHKFGVEINSEMTIAFHMRFVSSQGEEA